MKVFVATYTHRHGRDIRVFTTAESAWAWGLQLAQEYWEEFREGEAQPEDRNQLFSEYWEAAGDSAFKAESFDYEELAVEQ